MKSVCVTGYGKVAADKIEYVRQELHREIKQAIGDGFTLFLSGFAEGADLEFAAIVAELKKDNPALFLEAAIPYSGRMKTKDRLFHELITQCNGIKVISKAYDSDCYFARNRYLVNQAERVIAVFDGRERSATAQTMRMAAVNGRDLRVIDISDKPEE